VRARRELIVLATVFWTAVAWSAIHPLVPSDYWIEIATPIAGFLLLVTTRPRFPFTPLGYRLMFAEALVLIVGAHYTHERVPAFEWLKEVFGTSRNDYDRFAHFCVGFLLVIPVREILARCTSLRGSWLAVQAAVSVLAFAAFYEITEWWIAALASPEAGQAYLGSQGDPWDAQKDMLLDGIGAVVGVVVLAAVHDRQLRALPAATSAI
jgi:putative membrane protein